MIAAGEAIAWLLGRRATGASLLDILLPVAIAAFLLLQHRPPPRKARPVAINDLAEDDDRPTGDPAPVTDDRRSIATGIRATLEMLHAHLGLTSAVLLWPRSDGFAIRSAVSARSDLVTDTIPVNAGIIAALQQQRRSVAMAPVRTEQPMAPWYAEPGGIGGLIAVQVPIPGSRPAILAADRTSAEPWSDAERDIIETTSQRLAVDFTLERRLLDLNRDLERLRTVSQGLVELSGVLGVESVCEATARAVAAFLDYDLLAISLREETAHFVVYVEGDDIGPVVGRRHGLDEGIVGQVLRTNHRLPAGGVYRGPAPIFTSEERFEGYRSLLVLPLRSEDGRAIAALTVAGRRADMIHRGQLEILELIGAQVGVKIDLAQAHEKIRLLATTDGLTGLANHRTFQHAFDMMLERTRRNQCPLCLILCDIDHFKQINDTYGHPFGDQVLQRVAEVFRKTVRKVDLAARYGGEEFALLLEAADEQGGRQMAERIRRAIERLVIARDGHTVPVTVSMGLAFFPKDAEDKESLISHADQALYRAKAAGRNRIVSWSELSGGRGQAT